MMPLYFCLFPHISATILRTMLQMTDIIVLALLGVLGISIVWMAVRLKKEEDPARKPSPAMILVLSIVAVGLSVFQIMREVDRNAPYVYDPMVDEVLGRSLVEYFSAGDGEGVKWVIISHGMDGDQSYSRSARVRLDAFIDALRARGYQNPVVVSPLAVVRAAGVSPDDDYFMGMGVEMGIDQRVLKHVWETHPDAAVVVSMEGLPHQGLAALEELKPENSRLYALDLYQHWNWMPHVRDGFLDGVIAYRTDSDWTLNEGPDEVIFASRFIYVDPENYAASKDLLPETYYGVWD